MLDPTHLHLLFNHAGIFGVLFSTLILIASLLLKSNVLKRTAMIGFILSAIFTIVTMNSGEGAEERVEHMAGIVKSNIEAHEEAAELAAWLTGLTGLLSALGLFISFRGGRSLSWTTAVLLLMALAASASLSNTGLLGGKIRHTELSAGSVSAPLPSGEEDDD
jgi:uncharacterized membrane protein